MYGTTQILDRAKLRWLWEVEKDENDSQLTMSSLPARLCGNTKASRESIRNLGVDLGLRNGLLGTVSARVSHVRFYNGANE